MASADGFQQPCMYENLRNAAQLSRLVTARDRQSEGPRLPGRRLPTAYE